MNGRALNEKAIEVSPSSSRVLDRAADILTPFPPSKNRPRPGDWNCPSCGFSNFQRRTACFRCSFPAGGNNMYDPGYHMGGPYMGGQFAHPHHIPHGGHVGGHHGGGRGSNGPVPFRAGDWRCGAEGCSYHNFAKNVNCLRCGASRSGAAIVVDQSFTSPMGPPAPPLEYGMGPGSMASTPGPSPYGPGANAFASGSAFAQPPPQHYGMGGPGSGFPQMGGINPGYASSNASHHSFSHPNAQAAFAGADNTQMQAQGQNGFYASDQQHDPFSFLSSNMTAMNIQDENQNTRRNGNQHSTKSPA